MFNSTMSIKNKILLRKVLKYLVEGLAIAFVAFYLPRRKLKLSEILAISLTAATTLLILDTFTESNISDGTRFGAGFGIGANLVGFPAEGFRDTGGVGAHEHIGVRRTVAPKKQLECNNLISNLKNKEGTDCSGVNEFGIPNCIVDKCDKSPKPYETITGGHVHSLDYNKEEWEFIRSKYCEQSGDKYYNIGNTKWNKCIDKNTRDGNCINAKNNFKDSECLYIEAEKRIAQCGNGLVEGDEKCDDANTLSNDGCTLCSKDDIVGDPIWDCVNDGVGEGPTTCTPV
jgi:cysteine-rich repeat protein